MDKFGKELIEVSDPHTWVIESYLNSAKDIYPFVKDNSTITAEFDAKIKVLCRERVSLAGYRLGYMISQVYAWLKFHAYDNSLLIGLFILHAKWLQWFCR